MVSLSTVTATASARDLRERRLGRECPGMVGLLLLLRFFSISVDVWFIFLPFGAPTSLVKVDPIKLSRLKAFPVGHRQIQKTKPNRSIQRGPGDQPPLPLYQPNTSGKVPEPRPKKIFDSEKFLSSVSMPSFLIVTGLETCMPSISLH